MVMLIVLSVSIGKIVIEHSKLYNVDDTWCHKFLSCTVHSKSSHIGENPQFVFFSITAPENKKLGHVVRLFN